ncbi:MAG: M1 family metallopeptidase [Gammaproteobacteria bacterium]|nr:M1 family metallopeptidase [Gammaproteobacteria bacterium]
MKNLVCTMVVALVITLTTNTVQAKGVPGDPDKLFAQLDTLLPTPGVTRAASGAPGAQYWQQRADYRIHVSLDEKRHRLTAKQSITYMNRSPDTLNYIWLQLDQNIFKDDSLSRRSEVAANSGTRRDSVGTGDSLSFAAMRRHQAFEDREYGYEMSAVRDAAGRVLRTRVNDTMMRIDLLTPLRPGTSIEINFEWAANIVDEAAIGARGGYEYFPKNDTYQYFLAQWFPRLVAYTDYTGWQHKQFLGRGEFTLDFGDYDVELTVPADHIVASTGVLQNPADVLTAQQRARLKQAETAKKPVFVVTPEEALANEKVGTSATRTWRFKAANVRDFAWASSRKYIWDAMGYRQNDAQRPFVMAMSFYPNEGEPIWSKYSTHAVMHTMEVYSRFSFPYPYPVAISVNSWERGGMEYPMITFNGYRPTADEKSGKLTYSRDTKYGLIGVIIHEVGHIYFPMIVNSDERQWTWMDEGLNTFLEYIAELEWEENFPTFGDKTNVLDFITDYMQSKNQVPIMTNSDTIVQFGPNAYSKPAAALSVLREAIMGRELFDHAFREYANRWKFKRPTPADFFRTMEDASGVDLDWFWRGWFYGTDHVDVAVGDIREYQVSTQDPDVEFPLKRKDFAADWPESYSQRLNRNEGRQTRADRYPELKDFYNENDAFVATNKDRNEFKDFREKLRDWERKVLDRSIKAGEYVYFVDFRNLGGLVTPLPLTLTYADGSTEEYGVPAEIWRYNAVEITKLFVRKKRLVSVELDRNHLIADADKTNNITPRRIEQSRIELFKGRDRERDQMLDALAELKGQPKAESQADAKDLPLQPAAK